MLEARTGAVEPVHWHARLLRTPSIIYTEVAGIPLLVDTTDAAVHPLTPAWAALWAQLDGRPILESLNVNPDLLTPVDARNLIEVLRRLKALGVIVDADPNAALLPSPDLTNNPTSNRVTITLRGSIEAEGQSTSLLIGSASEQVKLRLEDTARGIVVCHRRRFRYRAIDSIHVAPQHGSDQAPSPEPADASEAAAQTFAAIAQAFDDPAVLLTPGLVDLLAGLAERATPLESLHR